MGTEVELGVCCEGQDSALTRCQGMPPLRLQPSAELPTDQSVSVTVVPVRLVASDPDPDDGDPSITAWIIARLPDSEQPPTPICAPGGDGGLRTTLPIQVLPVSQ